MVPKSRPRSRQASWTSDLTRPPKSRQASWGVAPKVVPKSPSLMNFGSNTPWAVGPANYRRIGPIWHHISPIWYHIGPIWYHIHPGLVLRNVLLKNSGSRRPGFLNNIETLGRKAQFLKIWTGCMVIIWPFVQSLSLSPRARARRELFDRGIFVQFRQNWASFRAS